MFFINLEHINITFVDIMCVKLACCLLMRWFTPVVWIQFSESMLEWIYMWKIINLWVVVLDGLFPYSRFIMEIQAR